MCTVILGLGDSLFCAANRDEWRARRATLFQQLAPGIFGGRDMQAGGTWFAIRPDNAMAFLTNVRPGSADEKPNRRTRGELPLQALGAPDMLAWARTVDVAAYNPFNLLFGRGSEWHVLGAGGIQRVEPGVHVLGNLSLDSADDRKTEYVRRALEGVEPSKLLLRLTELLRSDALLVDAGPYGTRWSMAFTDNVLRIAEHGIHAETWHTVDYR